MSRQIDRELDLLRRANIAAQIEYERCRVESQARWDYERLADLICQQQSGWYGGY
jgi:hypothetical protein